MQSQSSRISFPEAFMRERARYQISRAQIAQHVGVGAGVIRRWERGEAIPNIQQFKRLISRLPKVAPFAPDWGRFGEAVLDGRLDAHRSELAAFVEDAKRRGELDPKPKAQTFGEGLKRCREENEVTQDELGELLGITGQAVSQWETEDCAPVIPNLEKLYQVLPELQAGVETGAVRRPQSQDKDVPVGNRYPRASTVDTMLDMAFEQSDRERDRPFVPKPRHESQWAVDVSKDVEGKHHEHKFKSNERLGGASTREVCVVCGAPKPVPPIASEVRTVTPEHEHRIRRACPTCKVPCSREVDPDDASNALAGAYVCPKCLRVLLFSDTIDFTDSAALALAFARARIALVRAKAAEAAAMEAVVNATTARKDAERECDEAMALLDLAVQEEAG